MSIFKKEFLSYFRSNIAYFVLAVYGVLSMIVTFYAAYFFQVNNANLFSFFYYQPQILAMLLPALTMRLWAEEKRSGTIEFLLTQPVSYNKIVFEKFLAAWAASCVLLLTTIPFLVYCSFLIDLDYWNIFSSYLACVLVVGAFCAIGCAISSFNSSSITAYLLTLVACWAFTFANPNVIVSKLSSEIVLKTVQSFNFSYHYAEFLSGQIGIDNIIYFAVIMLLALWINAVVVEYKKKGSNIIGFAVLVVVSFFLLNICAGLLFGSYRADFTKSGKYTLSSASREIVSDMKRPVYIKVYLSSNLAAEYPQYGQYAQFVVRFLKQYEKYSKGNIEVEVRNPILYSLSEKEAKDAYIKPILDKSGKENLYFGMTMSDSFGNMQVIPNFVEQRAGCLEEDISRMIYRMDNPDLKIIGVIAPSKVDTQQFLYQLQTNYKLEEISPDATEIPVNIDALVIFNSEGLKSFSVYALDQYIMRGGKVLMFADAYSEFKANIVSFAEIKTASMRDVMLNIGVETFPELVAGDVNLSEKTAVGAQVKNYFVWMNIPKEYINQNNPITKGISRIKLRTPAVMEVTNKEKSTFTDLFTSSPSGGLASYDVVAKGTKEMVLNTYKQSDVQFQLGALIEGEFFSVFKKDVLNEAGRHPFLDRSIAEAKIVVIADSDMIINENWAIMSQVLMEDNEVYGVVPLNGNMELVQRALDYLTGNDKLLDIAVRDVNNFSQNLMNEITAKVYQEKAEFYNKTAYELFLEEQSLRNEEDKLVRKQETFSLAFAKKIDEIGARINEKKELIKYMDYMVKQERDYKLYSIVVICTAVFPLMLVLLFWLGFLVLGRLEKQKALELLNEQKDS